MIKDIYVSCNRSLLAFRISYMIVTNSKIKWNVQIVDQMKFCKHTIEFHKLQIWPS